MFEDDPNNTDSLSFALSCSFDKLIDKLTRVGVVTKGKKHLNMNENQLNKFLCTNQVFDIELSFYCKRPYLYH